MATALPTKAQFDSQSVTEEQFKAAMDQLIDYLTELKAFPTGTRLLFQQTTAPIGWTKDTTATFNDAALRIVTGAVSSGGADAFTATFGTSKSTAAYALQVSDMPTHSHAVNDPGHLHGPVFMVFQAGASVNSGGGFNFTTANTDVATTGITLSNAGGGAAHSHTLSNMNLKYVDTIVASKD